MRAKFPFLHNILDTLDWYGYNPLEGNKYETQDLLSLGGFLFAKLFDTRVRLKTT